MTFWYSVFRYTGVKFDVDVDVDVPIIVPSRDTKVMNLYCAATSDVPC